MLTLEKIRMNNFLNKISVTQIASTNVGAWIIGIITDDTLMSLLTSITIILTFLLMLRKSFFAVRSDYISRKNGKNNTTTD